MRRSDMGRESTRRVVVTGMGAITGAGIGTPALESALRGTEHCFRDVTLFPTEGLRVRIAGEVETIPPSPLAPLSARRRASRSDRLALAAVGEALAQSGIDVSETDPKRVGVAIGTSTGGLLETEEFYVKRLEGVPAGRSRPQLLSSTVGAPTDMIACAIGALGPRLAPSTACSSGAIAIAQGLAWIRHGVADLVIAGGTEALCRMTYTGFNALQALAQEPCRPFDKNRKGLTLGEAAGVLVLEDRERAMARSATIIGEVLGSGLSCDANHPTAPHPEGRGARQALESALASARLDPRDLGYVNAHGTGTPQNDVCESRALNAVFGSAPSLPPVSSTKGLLGHTLAAAGAIEAVITLIGLRGGFAPPTLGLTDPDPDCELDLVQGEARPISYDIAASNSYGFGGNNCSLIFARP